MQNRRSVLFGDVPYQPGVLPLFVVAKTIPDDPFRWFELVYTHPEEKSSIVKAQLRNASDLGLNDTIACPPAPYAFLRRDRAVDVLRWCTDLDFVMQLMHVVPRLFYELTLNTPLRKVCGQ